MSIKIPFMTTKLLMKGTSRRSRRTPNRRRVSGSDTQRMDFLHSTLRVIETNWNGQERRKTIV